MGGGECCGERCLEEKDNICYDKLTNFNEEEKKDQINESFSIKGKLEKIKTLDKGGFGKVIIIQTEKTKEIFVSKQAQLDNIKSVITIVKEQYILQKINHPNIISFKQSFKDKSINSINIIEEYARGGNLRHQIKDKKNFEENTLIFWLFQMCLALSYLHRKKIIHRDIKPENILLTETHLIKIGDFGLAIQYESKANLKRKFSIVGTPYYMAPEIKSGIYEEKVDIYSLGKTFNDFLKLNKNYSEELVKLVNSFMEEEPTKRPTSEEILNSSIIQKGMKIFLNKHNYENSLAKSIMRNITIKNNNIKDVGDDIFIKDIKNERKKLVNERYNKYIEKEDSKDLDIIMCIIKKNLNDEK